MQSSCTSISRQQRRIHYNDYHYDLLELPMRRPAKRISQKLAPDSKRIADLAQAMTLASSRLEQRFWEQQLDTQLARLLKNANQPSLEATMNHLFKVDLDAYDALMEAIEAGSESTVLDEDSKGIAHQALLIALPILAWTRFAIASSAVPADVLASLCVQLQAHVLADNVQLAMIPMLYSIDQLPRTHVDIHAMLHNVAQAALESKPLTAPAKPPETAPFLADSRYLLAVVMAPLGQPLFRWQASTGSTSATQKNKPCYRHGKPRQRRTLHACCPAAISN